MDGSTDIVDVKAQRRAKKAERRAKQRAANPLRAAKMHKARIDHPLPRIAGDLPALNIGCSGWFYWDWRGKFYPQQMPTSEWFATTPIASTPSRSTHRSTPGRRSPASGPG